MNFSERAETSSSGGDIGFVSESQMKADPAGRIDILLGCKTVIVVD